MSEASEYAKTMSCDEDLLPALGRVMWAAVRLHASVRDAINWIDGIVSDAPFEPTLGNVVNSLRDKANSRVREPDRTALLSWYASHGRPAYEHRNDVAHARTYTAEDGKQAIGRQGLAGMQRFSEDDLYEIAGLLAVAARELPPGPYATK